MFAGKIVTSGAFGKAGVSRELVEAGEHASMWSTTRPFTDDELVRLDRWLDDVYADFTGKAAAGRDRPLEELEPLARGRVWTGADAKERGLVDQLGGLEQAVEVAAELAGAGARMSTRAAGPMCRRWRASSRRPTATRRMPRSPGVVG